MTRTAAALVFALGICAPLHAAGASEIPWSDPKPVDPNTVFFGETRGTAPLAGAPDPSDKNYPWYCLEKGSAHFLAKEFDHAAIYFRAAYSVPGATRVIAGFQLVEALEKGGLTDAALETLDELEREYLVSPREFQEELRVRQRLLDRKRKELGKEPEKTAFTGRDWIAQLQAWRLRYVLEAMEKLRGHRVPLKEAAQGYVFLLDEHFLANPDAPAGDAAEVLAGLVYERDANARVPIDLWRQDPDKMLTDKEARALEKEKKRVFTGAEWTVMVHRDKLEYTAGAMKMLNRQQVPMEKSLYGYTDALDKLFTQKPELPASDSVVALGSYLYETEPKAKEVLEALRLS